MGHVTPGATGHCLHSVLHQPATCAMEGLTAGCEVGVYRQIQQTAEGEAEETCEFVFPSSFCLRVCLTCFPFRVTDSPAMR